MNIIDMHSDTIYRIINNGKKESFKKNSYHIDIEKMKKANSIAQFFAMFFDKEEIKNANEMSLKEYGDYMIEYFKKEIEKNSNDISIAKSYEDLLNNINNKKISAFITFEGGEVLEGSLDNLEYFYEKGLRLLTLTWNYENEIGYPNIRYEYMNKGLKPFGSDLIEYCNHKGIILDVSHLSDKGFEEVSKLSKSPFIASHSNSRFVKEHPRNLSDDMIKAISNKGGIIGVNFAAYFLGSSKISRVEDYVKHIKHIKNIGGVDSVSFGSDFDGISCDLEIKDISYMNIIINEMRNEGFSELEIEKIAYKNAMRVIKDIIK